MTSHRRSPLRAVCPIGPAEVHVLFRTDPLAIRQVEFETVGYKDELPAIRKVTATRLATVRAVRRNQRV